jgi:hypothetical protein
LPEMTALKVDAVPLDYDKSPYRKPSALAVADNSRFVLPAQTVERNTSLAACRYSACPERPVSKAVFNET